MNSIQVDELPVVKEDAPNDIVGMLTKRDIISYYHSRTQLQVAWDTVLIGAQYQESLTIL